MALKPMMAEMFGRVDGIGGGRGGEMHAADPALGILGGNGIVGGGLPYAAGAALSASLDGDGRVAVAFFGEGASNNGAFAEDQRRGSLEAASPDGLREQPLRRDDALRRHGRAARCRKARGRLRASRRGRGRQRRHRGAERCPPGGCTGAGR